MTFTSRLIIIIENETFSALKTAFMSYFLLLENETSQGWLLPRDLSPNDCDTAQKLINIHK